MKQGPRPAGGELPSYSEILKSLERSDTRALQEFRIVILRNITIEPLVPYLRYYAQESGLRLSITMGGFDTILQDVTDGGLVDVDEGSDCVLVYAVLEQMSWKLAREFPALTVEDIRGEVNRIERVFDVVCANLRRRTRAMILWHGFVTPSEAALGMLDAQMEHGQTATIRRLNEALRRRLADVGNAYLVDVDRCVARLGADVFFDRRWWAVARAPYSRVGLVELAGEAMRFVRAAVGRNRKCVVVDCDNVLWGGILGEDGVQGIKLGSDYPGAAFREFQQELVNLFNRGIIIALCSKNNSEDVWEVFRSHPDMILLEGHIAAARVNWMDKPTNLRDLAKELNIGLDSFVFCDDDSFEVEFVRRELPEVKVVHLPADRPSDYCRLLASVTGLFDALVVSAEDRRRGTMYREEAERRRLQEGTSDVEGYLASLEMIAEVKFVDWSMASRVSQQTMRTNQFNLTDRRYSEPEIRALADGESSDVMCLRLQDKLGDSGIVAACILRYAEEDVTIDTFVVSCRVLGRGVERVLLSEVVKHARREGVQRVIGEFVATGRNSQVKEFYASQGFEKSMSAAEDGFRKFTLLVGDADLRPPAYFKAIRSEVGTRR